LRGVFDPQKLFSEIEELKNIVADASIWDNKEYAQKILKKKSNLEEKLSKYNELQQQLKDNANYAQLAFDENDTALIQDISGNLLKLLKNVNNYEIECLFNEENDDKNAFIDINAGAGGTDSCDFALILMRMYQRFALAQNFQCEIIDSLDGEEAGIRSATLKISGKYAYGWLKNEIGIHRLVRISPFNSNGKRQTSFCSIWIYPEIDDEIIIDIQDKDLRIDTFRASGAGGQHVNKTDSAVRITHIPTNIVVQCQSDRSQIRNRNEAMKMLKSKLYETEIKKKKEELQNTENLKSDNSFGHQIRSYVMHPYQLVKDLRTNYETGNIEKVLNGDINEFIKSMLIKKINLK
jgi:peptide chain release factor 2